LTSARRRAGAISGLNADQHRSLLYSSDLELGEAIRRILAAIGRFKPKRVVIDSLSEIRLLAQSSLRYRRQILALKHYFARHQSTVLLLDDMTTESMDRAVHSIAHSVIGSIVHEVGSGGAAFDFLEREQNVDLMLIDFAMPGMSGANVARRVHMRTPSLSTLFVTGFADRTALTGVTESRIIGKPFEPIELARKVRAALAERRSSNVVRFRGWRRFR
jgi:CheY-like chemotaxis protein